MSAFVVEATDDVRTCPNCGQRVRARKTYGGFVCPLCGHHMSGGSQTKEGRRMSPQSDAERLLTEAASADNDEQKHRLQQQALPLLLREAAAATTLPEQQRFVALAEEIRSEISTTAAESRALDLAQATVAERLTPARVHEMHGPSTDWLGGINTTASADAEREMVAQGSVWYSKLAEVIKQHPDELTQQALGMARRLAGRYGQGADAAERAFLDHVGQLHTRDLTQGLVIVAAMTDQGVQGPEVDLGLPGEATSSERAPAMRDVMDNASGGSVSDTDWPDPLQLPQADVDAINGDSGTQRVAARSAEKGSSMEFTAACPECSGCTACAGTHRVAVRGPRTAASGLDQIDQTIDSHDNPKATPYPTDVAFPWEMPPNSGQAIAETERQLAEREQRKGASRQSRAEYAAKRAAEQTYRQVMGGYDASGWAGDMGAGGYRPGMQDSGNPGNTFPGNLVDADPVYGTGGDNGNQPLKPYGADEADDYTNNPGMNVQPGAPMQYDQAARPNQVGAPTASRRSDNDPEIQKALNYVRQRRALLDS